MPRYTFTAIDTSGRERSGSVEAPSLELASTQVKSMGLFPTNVVAEEILAAGRRGRGRGRGRKGRSTTVRSRPPVTFGRIIGNKGLTVFTRQLATLTQSGLPLLRSIEILARQEKNPAFKWVLEQLADNIRSGNTLSEGLQAHPRIFNRLYVNMVRAGEAGGVLDVVLNRLARFMEKAGKIRGRIRAAMIYPIVIMAVTVIILSALMIFVIPQFEGIYSSILKGAALPRPTRIVLGIADFVRGHFVITVALIGVLAIGIQVLSRTARGARSLDWMKLNLPGVGDLMRKAAIARFSRTLGTLLSSGVPILQALQITRETSGNALFSEALEYVHDRVKEGEGIASPLDQTHAFPAMVTSMVDVGEETGELYEMLNRIADTFDEEVDNSVAAVTSMIEPVLIVFMAVVVGGVVIALFLPIVEMIKQLPPGG